MSNENPIDKYWINRVRFSNSLADDYSKALNVVVMRPQLSDTKNKLTYQNNNAEE
jgi:hypothetical protein